MHSPIMLRRAFQTASVYPTVDGARARDDEEQDVRIDISSLVGPLVQSNQKKSMTQQLDSDTGKIHITHARGGLISHV